MDLMNRSRGQFQARCGLLAALLVAVALMGPASAQAGRFLSSAKAHAKAVAAMKEVCANIDSCVKSTVAPCVRRSSNRLLCDAVVYTAANYQCKTTAAVRRGAFAIDVTFPRAPINSDCHQG